MIAEKVEKISYINVSPINSPREIPNLEGYKKANSLNGIKIITQTDIDGTLQYASTLQRARAPLLVHKSYDETPQRFINCLHPGSYVRPHMHVASNQWELKCWLSGDLIALLFDNEGRVKNKIIMNENNVRIVEIPPFCYHSIMAVEKGAYLEIRNGRFQPATDKIYSSWSPEENSALAEQYYKRYLTAEVGDLLTV
ncbi:MAG: WbuC family cupin fold metalloprotein [Gammaproteobacteria bacterium]|nr:WbuC family cupin fold metalloprotein [Gammaproteobacteria bacterium]